MLHHGRQAAGRNAGVETCLLHRGAKQHASVTAGNKVLPQSIDDPCNSGETASVDADYLAAYRFDGQRQSGNPVLQTGPRACRNDNPVRADPPVWQDDPGHPVSSHNQV